MGLTQSSGAPEGGTEGYHVHGVITLILLTAFDSEQLCMLAMHWWSYNVRIALALSENSVSIHIFF